MEMLTNDQVMALKGADLKAKAAELAIPGRSKMTVVELREAISTVYRAANTPIYREETLYQPRSMDNNRRIANYLLQNGSFRLTPAQNRRIRKKTHK